MWKERGLGGRSWIGWGVEVDWCYSLAVSLARLGE